MAEESTTPRYRGGHRREEGPQGAGADGGRETAPGLLAVEELRVDFATGRGWATVVDGVSLTVGDGETVGLVGESGSGKTVTGLSVLGLVPSPPGRRSGGRILLRGEDLAAADAARLRAVRGAEIAMIFQEPMTSLNPAFTVGDQIAESYRLHRGASRAAARRRAAEVLDLVGIPNAARRLRDYPHEFSGGMRQRAMIAMALVCEPQLIIADEPTTALDVTVQAQILDLLLALRAELGMGLLLITHDLGVVAEVCDRVAVMYAGQVVEESPAAPLFTEPRHPYTDGLLTAMPQVGGSAGAGRLASIPGATPEPWAMPPGCRFAPRCPHAADACTAPVPLAAAGGTDRSVRCARSGSIELRGIR